MKSEFIALRRLRGKVTLDGKETFLKFPKGAVGMYLSFEDKKDAYDFFDGAELNFAEVTVMEPENEAD